MTLLKNKAFIISMILWCFITVVRILNHIPWYDEAHAWTIAEQLNLFQLVDFMKIEGHTILWYVLLMPFAKLHLGYPYSMQFLNWIFCFIALILFWKKAPFNNLVKVLVTFSFPFLVMYSVYARCYSIGIMLLFILCILYKNKLKNPVLYSLLIILCANTSAMALIGAMVFGLFFVYDFIKSKPTSKNLLYVGLVLLIGAVLLALQILGVNDSALDKYKGIEFYKTPLMFSILKRVICEAVVLSIVTISTFVCVFKNKIRPLLFLLCVSGFMTYCFMFRFYGHYWNHAFYFIYLIIALWLGLDNYKLDNYKVKAFFVTLFLSIISITQILVPFYIKTNMLYNIFSDDGIRLSKLILEDKKLDGKTIILTKDNSAGFILLPYNKYKIKNYCESDNYSYDVRFFTKNSKYCTQIHQNSQFKSLFYLVTKLNMDRLLNFVDDDEVYTNIPVNDTLGKKDKVSIKDSHSGYIYTFEKYKSFRAVNGLEYSLYKITRNKNK